MRVALAQIDTTVGDIWGNVEKMADALERATDSGADLIAYPELTIPGYPPEDLLMRPSFIEENMRALDEFARVVCEDMWYPGGPAREQALAGASVLLNVNGSPYHRQKILSRERMLRVRASDSGCYVAWCNLVGGQDELVFDGASVVIDPEGNVAARARQFEEDLLLA